MADQDVFPGGTATYPSDTALNEFLDRNARTVWRRMVAAGWKPDKTVVAITANGSASYTVGSDVSTVNSVHFLSSASNATFRTPLHRIKPGELPALLASSPGARAVAYDFYGGGNTTLTIELYPTPSSGAYEVRYTKRFAGFSADGDNWFGPDGSDELIILLSAIDAVNKEGDPADMVRMLKDKLSVLWPEVLEAAGYMDPGQQSIKDVTIRSTLLTGYPEVESADDQA